MNTEGGTIGLPAGVKESGRRVDFRVDDFDAQVEIKGYRLAWSRAALCPCVPVNDQTEQPDPNCTDCKGKGWFYFTPSLATTDRLVVGDLDDLQTRLISSNKSAVIRGLMTGITNQPEPYDPLGRRLMGVMNLTVRPENRLGYYDKIVNLDSTIVYTEILDVEDPTAALETRYPVVQINLLRSIDQVYTAPTDFTVTEGRIIWNVGGQGATTPAAGDRLVAHYLCHPTWLVAEHPHAVRLTQITRKVKKPTTPVGNPTHMVIQAMVKYEFLTEID
jgi:hypothetical protein